jgi:hypothetical protein
MGTLPGSRFLPLSSQLLGNKQFWGIADMAAPARTAIVQVVGKGGRPPGTPSLVRSSPDVTLSVSFAEQVVL